MPSPQPFLPRRVRATFPLAGLLLLVGCGGGGLVTSPAPVLPVADAGADHVARVGTSVTLDGRASADPEGQPISFAWRQREGPLVGLSSETDARPGFTPSQPGTYGFELVVSDATGARESAPARVTVLVIDDLAAQPRRAPAAVARAAGLRLVAYLASAPSSAGGAPSVVLADGSVRPVVVVDLAGDASDDPAAGAVVGLLEIDLVAGGSFFARLYAALAPSDEDPVELLVPDGSGPDASAEIVAYGVVGEPFVLDGSRSHDDEVVKTWTWTQVSGPFKFSTQEGGLGALAVTPGGYDFELAVTDEVGLSSFPQRLTIPVVPAGQPGVGPPTAKVAFVSGTVPDGDDETPEVAVAGTPVVLSGAGSLSRSSGDAVAGGPDLAYSWRQVRGPTAAASGAGGSLLTVVPPVPGAYAFELTVTDAHGVSATTVAHLTVAAPGQPAATPVLLPIADAVLPTPPDGPLVVVLDATHSRGAGPLTFRWRQTAGMPVVIEDADTGLGRVTPPLPGTYAFELRVYDGTGLSAPVSRSFRVR